MCRQAGPVNMASSSGTTSANAYSCKYGTLTYCMSSTKADNYNTWFNFNYQHTYSNDQKEPKHWRKVFWCEWWSQENCREPDNTSGHRCKQTNKQTNPQGATAENPINKNYQPTHKRTQTRTLKPHKNWQSSQAATKQNQISRTAKLHINRLTHQHNCTKNTNPCATTAEKTREIRRTQLILANWTKNVETWVDCTGRI
jgi:hypothetical protein